MREVEGLLTESLDYKTPLNTTTKTSLYNNPLILTHSFDGILRSIYAGIT